MQNNYPLTKIDEKNYAEGYWINGQWCNQTKIWIKNNNEINNEINNENIMYPTPKPDIEAVSKEFIDKLKKLCETVFFNTNINLKSYMGNSYCRICGCENKNKEYHFKSGDITFKMPEGMFHYYINHNIHPSKEFYDFVMKYDINNIDYKDSDLLSLPINKLTFILEFFIKLKADKKVIDLITDIILFKNRTLMLKGLKGIEFTT